MNTALRATLGCYWTHYPQIKQIPNKNAYYTPPGLLLRWLSVYEGELEADRESKPVGLLDEQSHGFGDRPVRPDGATPVESPSMEMKGDD